MFTFEYIFLKKHKVFRGMRNQSKGTFRLKSGQTETMQENLKDWLQLDEGDPGFQFLVFLFVVFK
jgi:hypothetical protein